MFYRVFSFRVFSLFVFYRVFSFGGMIDGESQNSVSSNQIIFSKCEYASEISSSSPTPGPEGEKDQRGLVEDDKRLEGENNGRDVEQNGVGIEGEDTGVASADFSGEDE